MMEKTARVTSGGPTRKRLGDISNLPQQPKPVTQDGKEQFISSTAKEFIDQLQKENMMLVKVLAERDKIIEISGIELQKMRINLQKMQQQNFQLAQANSQMLADLNSSKDRLKILNHELGCKNGLLKAMKLELQEKENKRGYGNMDNQERTKEVTESSKAERADDEQCNANRKQPLKDKQIESKEKTENKRSVSGKPPARFRSNEPEPNGSRTAPRRKSARFKSNELEPNENGCVSRRQSARFKANEPEPHEEDGFEIDDVKFPASSLQDDQRQGDASTSTCLLTERDEKVGSGSENELRRSSIGRPLRQAAQKIQSYKEIPLNVKMRRIE